MLGYVVGRGTSNYPLKMLYSSLESTHFVHQSVKGHETQPDNLWSKFTLVGSHLTFDFG